MMKRLWFVLRVARLAWRVSNTQREGAVMYGCVKNFYGVPNLAMVVAEGREAWRVSTFAVEALKRIG